MNNLVRLEMKDPFFKHSGYISAFFGYQMEFPRLIFPIFPLFYKAAKEKWNLYFLNF